MIETYVKEYIAIGRYLKQHGERRGGFILIEKAKLIRLLDKNLYDTAANKLQLWKALKWIKTDGRHMDYPVMTDGKVRRMINMDMGILEQLERVEGG